MPCIGTDNLQSLSSQTYNSIIHFNARSLRKHFDDYQALFCSLRFPFPIICVFKTWLTDSDRNMFCFPNYNSEYNNCASSCHRGAAIFISKNVS